MDYQKILIAVDDTPLAERVAREGARLARRLQAEVALVSVVDTGLLLTDGGITPDEMRTLIKADLQKSQQRLLDQVFTDIKPWTFLEEGKIYEQIIKVAAEWQADILVLGTHGRTGLPHLLQGSVSEHVVRHSPVPVMVVPMKHRSEQV